MSALDLAAIEARAAAATPGPWRPGRPDMVSSDSSGGPWKAVYADDARAGVHMGEHQPGCNMESGRIGASCDCGRSELRAALAAGVQR